MKKRFAAVLATTALVGVTTAFAANPFSDVTADHWAYQAVSTLAAQGVVNGYPDGTFQGQKNITRYEMAQMIAKAMVHQDRMSAEQSAMLNRLASEFANELNNLGVRVGNLEKKVGNVRLTGDARLLYTDQKIASSTVDYGRGAQEARPDVVLEPLISEFGELWDAMAEGDNNALSNQNSEDILKSGVKAQYKYRVRIGANAQVNESTVAGVRLVMENEFGDTAAGTNNVKFDRAFVQHQLGDKVVVTVGRQGLFIGQGLIYDDTVDGVFATAKLGAADLTAGYLVVKEPYGIPEDVSATLVQANAKLGDKVDVVGYWLNGNENLPGHVYGAGLTANLGGKVTLDGEYAKLKVDDMDEGGKAWTAGLTYGDYNMAQKGTWNLGARYIKAEQYNPILASTFDNPFDGGIALPFLANLAGYKGWSVEANYALKENLGLKGAYYFNQENLMGIDYGDAYRVELNYKF